MQEIITSKLPLIKEEVDFDPEKSLAALFIDCVVEYAIYMLDVHGYVKTWNAGAKRIKGYRSDEIIGMHFSRFYTKEDRESGEPARSLQVASELGKFEKEGWRIRKDGSAFWASVVINAITDRNGELLGYAKIIRDETQRIADKNALTCANRRLLAEQDELITTKQIAEERLSELITISEQEKHAAAKLIEQNNLLVMAEDMAKIGYWRFDVQREQIIWSDQVYYIHGWPCKREVTFDLALSAYHVDDRDRVSKSITNAMQSGAPIRYEARLVRHDASIRHVRVLGRVEYGLEGTAQVITGVFQDITAMKEAESERERLLERITLANNAGKIGIWEWNLANDCISWDSVMFQLYGYDQETDANPARMWHEPIHSKDRQNVSQALHDVLRSGNTIELEYRIHTHEGTLRYLRTQGKILQDEHGASVRMIGTCWDITEVRELANQVREEKDLLVEAVTKLQDANRRAEEHSRAKSAFLAHMSHEIRTPLNGIIGLNSVLLNTEITEHQRAQLTLLDESASSLLAIINDILDLSKVEAGKIELEPVSFRPLALSESVYAMVREIADKKGVELTASVSQHVPEWIVGDSNRLRQILLNFLGNALKFTDNGRVRLVTTCVDTDQGKQLRCEVSDTGIGIAYRDQTFIFDSFAQVDQSTARKYTGTGLGLAISKMLVEAMHGQIGVSSIVGLGSNFWFTIPLVAGEPSVEHDVRRSQDGHVAKNILVVDDNYINRIVAKEMLEQDGHLVTLASNGKEGLAHLKSGSFDLVLMDMQMPVMDGLQTTREIRALAGDVSRIPIIALTANAMASQIEECLNCGMDDHIAKPIEREMLRNKISLFPSRPVSKPQGMLSLAISNLGKLFCDNMESVVYILAGAVDTIDANVQTIVDALERHDLLAVERASHHLKGTCSSIFVPELVSLADQLEQAAITNSFDMIEEPTIALLSLVQDLHAEMCELQERGF